MINELRIGNWVEYQSQFRQVSSISVEGFTQAIGLGGINTTTVNPIPLTPEILEKCGVFQTVEGYSLNGVALIYKNNEFSFWHNGTRIIIQYLHQLQNLYFALTGEELNYQP